MGKLDGKVALVTGSGRNIGRATVLKLAGEGAHVVVNARSNQAEADAVAREARDRGVRALAVIADVAKKDQVDAMVAKAMSEFGRIDILINNAGTSWGAPVENMTLEQWNKVIETNLTGTFLFSQTVGRAMIAQRRGKIINIASVAGLRGSSPKFSAIGYSASKGGVIIFTKDLACKWGMHNIQVNAIAPGWFPTDMSEKVIERNKESLLAGIPLGRFGGPQDLKGAAIFLASSASDFVTGQILAVDGGQSA